MTSLRFVDIIGFASFDLHVIYMNFVKTVYLYRLWEAECEEFKRILNF